jgi:hypothetical protein
VKVRHTNSGNAEGHEKESLDRTPLIISDDFEQNNIEEEHIVEAISFK